MAARLQHGRPDAYHVRARLRMTAHWVLDAQTRIQGRHEYRADTGVCPYGIAFSTSALMGLPTPVFLPIM